MKIYYLFSLFFIKNSWNELKTEGGIKVAASLATMTNLKKLSLNLE